MEQGHHGQDVVGDNSHVASLFNRVMKSVSSLPGACNVTLSTDLPRRRTFDIESLKNEESCCPEVNDDICQDQNSKIVTHQASETTVAERGWNMGSIARPIEEDHPRRTNGYKQIREETTQGTTTIPSVILGSRREASDVQGHRRGEPFISDIPRRRQVDFATVGGYATENTLNDDRTFSQATHEVSSNRPEETEIGAHAVGVQRGTARGGGYSTQTRRCFDRS